MKSVFLFLFALLFISCEEDCGCVTPPRKVDVQEVMVELKDADGNDILNFLKNTNQLYNTISLWCFKNDYISENVLKSEADFSKFIVFNNPYNYSNIENYISMYRIERWDKKTNVNKIAIHYNGLYRNDTIEVFYKPEVNYSKKIDKIALNGEIIVADSVLVNDYITYKKITLIK